MYNNKVCLRCRRSTNLLRLIGGDFACVACNIRFSSAGIKAYNRFARMLRLYNGEEVYIHRRGVYTPSGEYLRKAQEQCWREGDGKTDIQDIAVPF